MRMILSVSAIAGLAIAATVATAQRPDGGRGTNANSSSVGDDLASRMMTFDANKDGKLTEAEITDARLVRLFHRADADKDGVVTNDELNALAAKERANDRFGRGGPGGFGPGGPGGGPGGFMGPPPRPGEILPMMVQNRLRLTPDQKKEIDALQKEVDSKLEKILNDEQKKTLEEMRRRGPGGPGGPPRGGRPGGPGGGPPPDRNE